jgi:hypothetical protein
LLLTDDQVERFEFHFPNLHNSLLLLACVVYIQQVVDDYDFGCAAAGAAINEYFLLLRIVRVHKKTTRLLHKFFKGVTHDDVC